MTGLINVLPAERILNSDLSFTVCVNDAQPVDNSVFCSGDFVVCSVTEQRKSLIMQEKTARSGVPVFLGGMGRRCDF